MKEIWKEIPGYEGLYQISNLGRVKSLERYNEFYSSLTRKVEKRIIKMKYKSMKISNVGYYQIDLWKNNVRKRCNVHRLVAEAFIPNPENNPQVNHKDGNKLNNNVDNLEWCTQQENTIHAVKNNLIKKGNESSARKNFSKKIKQYSKDGKFIKKWECMSDAQRYLNILSNNIGLCCAGERKTAGGYIWKYDKK